MKKASLTKLTIENIQYYGYHGVKKEEKKLGSKYEVDLELYYDARNAAAMDDVSFAVNYEDAMFIISEIMVGDDSYNLIETICEEILNRVMDSFEACQKVTCRVRKYSVPTRRLLDYTQAEQTMERYDEK
jgi:7,8-dihydroneopterin aldolase/epimerase/oxygenase